MQRTVEMLPRFFGVRLDIFGDPVDQRMRNALPDRLFAPA
jgi:hypothetical protein